MRNPCTPNRSLCWAVVLCVALSPACRRHSADADLSRISFGQDGRESALLRGFHSPEESWRWTGKQFAFTLTPPPGERPLYLELDFSFPAEVASKHSQTVLNARVNGIEVGSESYRGEGRYLFSREVPEKSAAEGPVEVLFETSATVEIDGEERGLIVVSAAFKSYEQSADYRRKRLAAAHRDYEELLRKRNVEFPVEKQKEVMKLFHDLDVWNNLWFQGVRIIKNPLDLWMMQQIIYEVQPDFIIETGTWYGGSALYWAQALHGMGLTGSRVFTVDINDHTRDASKHFLWEGYVQFFLGSSIDPKIAAEIQRRAGGARVIVFLDSDHSMTHVREEIRLYSPLVSPGSYLVVEDTHYDAIPTQPDFGPGPAAAVSAFLSEGGAEHFERDLTRETLIMTSNPGGWLKRK